MPKAKGSLLDITKEMDTLAVVIQLRALELTKFVAFRTLEYLVDVTPVDTSKALSNWVVSVSGSTYGASAIPALVPGAGGSSQAASAAIAKANGKEALKRARAGSPVAIINVVPYIVALNEGSSQQAPAGFVDRATLVGKQATKEYNFRQRLQQDIRRGRVKANG
jgi:hypothetical protein